MKYSCVRNIEEFAPIYEIIAGILLVQTETVKLKENTKIGLTELYTKKSACKQDNINDTMKGQLEIQEVNERVCTLSSLVQRNDRIMVTNTR